MGILITLVVVIIVFALLFYCVDLLPFEAKLKQLVKVLLIVIAIVYLLGLLFGGFPVVVLR